jgi:Na+/proline symporter
VAKALVSYWSQLVAWFGNNSLGALDWAIIIAYLVISLAIGLYFTRRSGKDTAEYFLSGRTLSWWLLGSSMIATSFAADTPLLVTEYIRSKGVWGNWTWMAIAIGQLFAVFSFSLFWRRSEVLTDNQLIEMRYSGRAAPFLRAFKALIGATLYNFIVMGWVLTAMGDVSEVALGIPKVAAVVICSVITLIYAAPGGFWAVVITDFFQLALAMGGMVVLAFYAVTAVGGLEPMRAALSSDPHMAFMPPREGGLAFGSPMFSFLTLILVSWWASHNADGGGYMMQRMASAKDERHSRLGLLWFVVGTYALRLWPWIIVAGVSLILFPTGDARYSSDEFHKQAFPMVMQAVLKHPGLMGLMIAVFLAAFMSTITTHVNWGASYIIHDLYRRFLVKDASEKHYVRVSYVASVVVLTVAGIVACNMGTISGAFEFVRAMGAGVGVILILRWFWWRINAWTEIAALASSLAIRIAFECAAFIQCGGEYELFNSKFTCGGITWDFTAMIFVIVPVSAAAAILATMLTQPTDRVRLVAFFRKVRPGGAWGSIPDEAGVTAAGLSWEGIAGWLASVAFIYCFTFGIGKVIFGPVLFGWELLLISAVCAWLTWSCMREKNAP